MSVIKLNDLFTWHFSIQWIVFSQRKDGWHFALECGMTEEI